MHTTCIPTSIDDPAYRFKVFIMASTDAADAEKFANEHKNDARISTRSNFAHVENGTSKEIDLANRT